MEKAHKAGFVNIFGAPNAGKSTLLNALLGENLAITSPKVQTTRHRILGILTEPDYQIVFSDTPGIIEPKYGLHKKMMQAVKSALEDADVALLMADATEDKEDFFTLADGLRLKVPTLVLLNKVDLMGKVALAEVSAAFAEKFVDTPILHISAAKNKGLDELRVAILERLPDGEAFYPDDDVSDRPTRFFAAELIREGIYALYGDEIPYHTAVVIESFEEKSTLSVVKASIVVSRETQKMILIGKGGAGIKALGIRARQKIEEFTGSKIHLELFVKVRPKWRDNETYLREYGYNQ